MAQLEFLEVDFLLCGKASFRVFVCVRFCVRVLQNDRKCRKEKNLQHLMLHVVHFLHERK